MTTSSSFSAPSSIETAVTRMLGIRYPIVVAPMFLVSNAQLLIAVAKAGGIAGIPSLNFRTHPEFDAFLREFPEGLPFGVNLIIKWGDERLEKDLASIVARKVPLVITSLGDPTPVVQAVHAYGGKVFCDVISLRHAEKAARAGADALIAVSSGAGGHAGPISPIVLGPWLRQAVGLPVVLAGALSTGNHLLAALSLGMDAGYFGTRFIATPEAGATDEYKQALVAAGPEDVEYSKEVTGVHANFLKPSLVKFRAGETGKAWRDVWSAGHGVAFIEDIAPAGELVERIARGYAEGKARLP